MGVRRVMAGAFIGVGALVLIAGGVFEVVRGNPTNGFAMIGLGTTPLTTMLGFFMGESNGKKIASETN